MKQYSLVVILHICLLAILSVGVYVLYCADLWFSMLITFLFLLGTGIHLYYIQMKQLQMMRRLTDSLRYNDMTQAFRPPYKNKLMTEMAVELSETLQAFRARLLEEEIKHQYYESLLNKVDTAVLVTDMSGRIEWLNRAATAQLGQDPQLPAELLSLPSGETQVIRIHRNGTTLEMAVATTLFVARGMERRLISLKNIHSVLERNEMEAWQKLIRVLTHEIMNSITPIISLSETLSERGVPVTLKDAAGEKEYAVMLQAMQTIHRRSKGLLGFVENYRRLTRLPAPVCASVPVRELFTDLQKLFPDETIHFELPLLDGRRAAHEARRQGQADLPTWHCLWRAWRGWCDSAQRHAEFRGGAGLGAPLSIGNARVAAGLRGRTLQRSGNGLAAQGVRHLPAPSDRRP